MNAQQMLLDYTSRNNDRKVYTDQQFIGKAMTEGVTISRTVVDMTVANVRREGKTIIVTETRKWNTIDGKAEETTEIFRINL